MKKFVLRFIFTSLALCLFAVGALAQSTSGVTGIVTDPTGAVVTGADVKLTDTKTDTELTTKTNDQGVYQFLRVAPGSGYTLTFSATGFETLVVQNVALGVGITETHNVQMTIGQINNTITVTAEAGATLNTTDATIGNVIEERRLKELPIQLRNSPASLLGLQPGVVGNNIGLGAGAGNRTGSVTGSRADQGNITIDGIDANDQATGQAFSTVGNAPIDAIQEFRAVTTNPGANEGRSSGGQIELVTKSGTNEFHGSLREFNRTAKTAANTFFNNRSGVKRPQLTRNQFGGSIGGPILKDKLFFFFDYEGRRDAQGVAYLRTVPLQHLREGRIAYLNTNAGCAGARLNTNPGCFSFLTPADIAARDPRGTGVNNALLTFINSRYPLPNDLTAGNGINTGGFRFNAPSKRADNTYTNRIDFNMTDKSKFFGRWNIARRVQTDTVNSVAQQFPGDPETAQIVVKDYAWVVGHTWVATPNIVNNVTVGVSRSGLEFPNNFDPDFPNEFTFTNLTAPFAGGAEQDRFVTVPTIRDDLTWVKGAHSFSFGTQIKPIDSKSGLTNDFNFVTVGGTLAFTTSPALRPANLAAAGRTNYDQTFAFILGRIPGVTTNFNYDLTGTGFPPGTGKHRDFKYNEYEFYGSDSWKARNDLTITAGLRWQFYPPPYEANGFQACNDVDFRNLFDIRLRNAALGLSGDAAEPILRYDLCGQGNNLRDYYEPDLNNFAPRLSFAWNPSFKDGLFGSLFGDRKTVIRGGGSVVYDRVGGAVTFIQDQVSYLFDNSATLTFSGANAAAALFNNPRFTGITTLPVANVAPVITRPFTPFVGGTNAIGLPAAPTTPVGLGSGEFNYAVDQQFVTPYAIQYSFGVQRELPGNFLFEASYVGRQARKLFTQADASQVLNFRDPGSGQFMLSAFNALQAGSTANQPWFENQVAAGLATWWGLNCSQFGQAILGLAAGASCTQVVANFAPDEIDIGDTSDAIFAMYQFGMLNPNVGMSGQFGTNIYISNQGASGYNGMLLSLRKRFSQGFQFDANYTFSKSLDNQSSIVNTVAGGLVCDLTNLRVCRGPSDFDIRHLVNVNGIWELPFGRGRMIGGDVPGWANAVIGGWEITGIFNYRSGLPWHAVTRSFPVGFNFDSPAVVTGNTAALNTTPTDLPNGTINIFPDPVAARAALDFPTHGQIGNRNFLRGPSYWGADIAVLKNWNLPWNENHRLQLRWEMYNAFNHNVFDLPSTASSNVNRSIRSTSLGQITASASSPREMQFALRYDF